MPVIRNGNVVDEPVDHLDDDDILPPSGAFSVSVTRWTEERESLLGEEGLGVRLHGDDALEAIVEDLDAFERIVVEFPAFTDGRCYTFARLLRERYGYEGELRAIGDVLRDQIFFMKRCGIDVFEVPEDKDPGGLLAGLDDFSVTYQTAADGRPPVYHRRPTASAAE